LRLVETGRYWADMAPPRKIAAGFVEPCLPTLATRSPSGADWVHEIKHDGCWVIIRRAASGLLGERHARLAKLVSLLSERPPRSLPSL
jgi:hypothetical protein